jgi:SAM-dependent methyltransferase
MGVLFPKLVAEWQLSASEAAYIDRQQGCYCVFCSANLRIVALGSAICAVAGTSLPLREAVAAGIFSRWRILDCNGVEGISTALATLSGYQRADYPECDMRRLPFADGSFDLVIHSDTLEHVERPLVALEECRRVLSSHGRLCFTVPIVVGRLTRGREGLPFSYHGDPAAPRADFVVQTEFGADAWTLVFEAGFSNVSLSQVQYPSAIALTAWNSLPANPSSERRRSTGVQPAHETPQDPARCNGEYPESLGD